MLITCPDCQSDMILRTASKGRYQGQQFYGCSRYPDCKTITPVDQNTQTKGQPESVDDHIQSVTDEFTKSSESSLITISRIKSASCPFSYYKEYVERPKPKKPFESAETAAGLFFHDYLEQHFQAIADNTTEICSHDLIDPDSVTARFEQSYITNGNFIPPYKIVRKDRSPRDYIESMASTTKNFNEFLTSSLIGHTVVDVEGALEIHTQNLCIRGRQDLITRDTSDQLILWDWKTGRPPGPHFKKDRRYLEVQLGIYAVWMKHNFKTDQVTGTAVFFRDKPETLTWSFRADLEQRVIAYANRWRDRLNSWTEYEPVASSLCPWCGWNPLCPGYDSDS